MNDNPFQPGMTSEVYVPDQLIAGRFPLVTSQAIKLTGGVKLARGSVLGRVTEGAVGAATGIQATGSLTFELQPAPADTITLNGTVITFVAANVIPGAGQVALGLTLNQTLENLIAYLQASADAQLVKFSYQIEGGDVLELTAVAGGVGGNALTLATTSAEIVRSGATLAGGVANTGNGTFGAIVKGATFKLGKYLLTMTDATHFALVDPNGDALPNGQTGVAYVDAQLGFTLTAGGTAFVAGDAFEISATQNPGSFQLSVATAVDGSQKPSAILGDDTDASGGDVNCAAYLTGEFNANVLNYDPSWQLPALTDALRPLQIHIRSTVSAAAPIQN